METRLCIDFGNTRVKLAVFDAELMRYFYKSEEVSSDFIIDVLSRYKCRSCIISTTRDLDKDFLQSIAERIPLLILDENTRLPIVIAYKSPKTLGKDRIAAAVGAFVLFPNDSCIIIDAGTCITMDFLEKNGKFLGGNISPGIHLRRQSMHEYTDKLPLVDLTFPISILGDDTVSALQNGILRGTIYEMRSFIKSVTEKYGHSKVILTGGDIKYFEERLENQIFASSNLVLDGLHEILKFNEL